MKKILILGLLGIGLFGKELDWMSYSEGMQSKEEKPTLYMLSATYCSYCHKSKDMMNTDINLNGYIEKNFLTVSQERDVEAVPSYLDNQLTPIYYVLDKKGAIVGTPLRGYQNKDTLLKYLNLSHYKFKNGN